MTKTAKKARLGPTGIHFFNRKTGLNVLLDEVIPPKSTWSLAPQFVSIALTNACDLECSHCYAPKENANLSRNFVERILKELDREGCLGIGFGGGEPTLYPNFATLTEFATKETQMAVSMTTHGHHLSDSLLEKIHGNVHFIRLSMDGVGATYEKIRGKSFKVFLDRLRKVSRKIPFGINFVVNDSTVSEISLAVNLAEKFGASEFLFLPELSKGRGNRISRIAEKKMTDWIHDYKGSLPLAISNGLPHLSEIFGQISMTNSNLDYAHVDANGQLKSNSMEASGLFIETRRIPEVYQELIQKGNKN